MYKQIDSFGNQLRVYQAFTIKMGSERVDG